MMGEIEKKSALRFSFVACTHSELGGVLAASFLNFESLGLGDQDHAQQSYTHIIGVFDWNWCVIRLEFLLVSR